MAILNGNANFFGQGSIPSAFPTQISVNNAATFRGSGRLDDWRISNRYSYDDTPGILTPGSGDMKLRKARLSMEGFFGDD